MGTFNSILLLHHLLREEMKLKRQPKAKVQAHPRENDSVGAFGYNTAEVERRWIHSSKPKRLKEFRLSWQIGKVSKSEVTPFKVY